MFPVESPQMVALVPVHSPAGQMVPQLVPILERRWSRNLPEGIHFKARNHYVETLCFSLEEAGLRHFLEMVPARRHNLPTGEIVAGGAVRMTTVLGGSGGRFVVGKVCHSDKQLELTAASVKKVSSSILFVDAIIGEAVGTAAN